MAGGRGVAPRAGPVLLLLAAAGGASLLGLNGDVRYALGGIRVWEAAGGNVLDVFVARPVAYRVLLRLLDLPRHLLTDDPAGPVAQWSVRAGALVLVALAALLLERGLRGRLPGRAGPLVALATGLALGLAPPFHLLEPDWVAALLGVAAVGAALAPRSRLLGGVLGGLLLALAFGVKVATAPLALAALAVVAALAPRRAAVAAGAGAVTTGLGWLALHAWLPWDLRWTADLVASVSRVGVLANGVQPRDVLRLLLSVADQAYLGPLVAALPLTVVVLCLGRARRDALRTAGLWVGLAGLATLNGYLQGEFFAYHLAGLPVVAAAAWGLSWARTAGLPAVRVALAGFPAAWAVVARALLSRPADWRHTHGLVEVLVLLVAGVAGLLALRVAVRRPRGPGGPRVPGRTAPVVVLVLSAGFGSIPGTPYAFWGYDNAATAGAGLLSGDEGTAGWRAVRERLGPDTPVLYLTFGSLAFDLQNPSACRYPSPQFLQRSVDDPTVRGLASYADNASCLTDTRARWVVLEPGWLDVGRLEPRLRDPLLRRLAGEGAFTRGRYRFVPLRP